MLLGKSVESFPKVLILFVTYLCNVHFQIFACPTISAFTVNFSMTKLMIFLVFISWITHRFIVVLSTPVQVSRGERVNVVASSMYT